MLLNKFFRFFDFSLWSINQLIVGLIVAVPLSYVLMYWWPAVLFLAYLPSLVWLVMSWKVQHQPHRYYVPSFKKLLRQSKHRIYGVPGLYAHQIVRQNTRTLTRVALGLSCSALAALAGMRWREFQLTPTWMIVFGVATLIGMVAAVTYPAPWFQNIGKAQAGIRHEHLTLTMLVKHPQVEAVVCGWQPPGGVEDVDAIVLNRNGSLTTVETKSGQGSIQWRNNQLMVGKKPVYGTPTQQALRTTKKVSQWLNLPVVPVVCYPRATGIIRDPNTGVWVIGKDQFQNFVGSVAATVHPEAQQTLTKLLNKTPTQTPHKLSR